METNNFIISMYVPLIILSKLFLMELAELYFNAVNPVFHFHLEYFIQSRWSNMCITIGPRYVWIGKGVI